LDSNITTGIIEFNPNDFPGNGDYQINISVLDSSGLQDSEVLDIQIIGNNLLQWDINTPTEHALVEDSNFHLELLDWVSDPDGDPITFSYSSDTEFDGFDVDPLTGIIDFTPQDKDVGQHIVEINASDVGSQVPLTFNFTVSNVNDVPTLQALLATNASVDVDSNVNTQEDNDVILSFFVEDDDFIIPFVQKGFYDEILSVDLNIEGPNTGLFSFVKDPLFPGPGNLFSALYTSRFTPRKPDIGYYNISITMLNAASKRAGRARLLDLVSQNT